MFKKIKLKKILKELATTLLLIFIIANVLNYFRAPHLQTTQLPTLQKELINGKKFDFSDQKGKALMVHFWATWCPICKAEASNIEAISQKYNVITLAVKSEDIKKYMQKRALHFKVINDKEGKIAEKFDVSVFPTTFIYNKKGELLFSDVGYTSTLMLRLKMFYASL